MQHQMQLKPGCAILLNLPNCRGRHTFGHFTHVVFTLDLQMPNMCSSARYTLGHHA